MSKHPQNLLQTKAWLAGLEHFHKIGSAALRPLWEVVFWIFGGVLSQLQTHCGYAPSPKPCQKAKILASHRYIFSVNALMLLTLGSLAPGATITWTNTSGGNWSAITNWSPNQVPTNTDAALITIPGTYTVVIDGNALAVNVAKLTLGAGGGAAGVQTLTATNNLMTSGSFTANSMLVTNGGLFNVGADYRGFGGALTVANGGVFTLNASHQDLGFGMTLVVTNGGKATASGTPLAGCCSFGSTFSSSVTVAAGGVLAVSGIAAPAAFTVAHGGVLDCTGISSFAALTNAGTLNVSNAVGAVNYGITAALVNAAGGVVNLRAGAFINGTFINLGTVTAGDGGAGAAGGPNTISVADFDNRQGTVTNASGVLVLGTYLTNLAGIYGAAAGATTQFQAVDDGTNFVTPGTPLALIGAGQFQFVAGDLYYPSNTIPNLDLQGTGLILGTAFQGGAITNLTLDGMATTITLPVTGTLRVTNSYLYGKFTVANGGIFTGHNATHLETLTVANGGVFDPNGDSIFGPLTVAHGGVLNLPGALALYTPLTNAGTINLTNAPINLNLPPYSAGQGGIINQAGGLINFWGDGAGVLGYLGTEILLNQGRIFQSAGLGTNTINVYDFDNRQGTVTNGSGTLILDLYGSLAGTFTALPGAVIDYLGANNTAPLTPGTPLALGGGGQHAFTSGQLYLPVNVPPALQLLGGTLELGAGFQGGAITNLTLGGMTLTNSLPVTGSLTTSNSTFYGRIAVAAGAVLNLPGPLNLYGPLTNAGTINMTNAAIALDNDGTTNAQGGVLNLASGLVNFWGDGSGIFGGIGQHEYLVNQGRITKGGGFGFSVFGVPFATNSGAITVQSGAILLRQLTLLPAGSLNVALNSAANYGSFAFFGSAVLGGAFSATLNNGYVPTNGTTFSVLQYPSFTGSFASLGLPAAVTWQSHYSSTNFTLVTAGAKPQFATFALAGTNLIFTGIGGAPGSNYVILASTNLTLPLANWPPLATNTFDASGGFKYTNHLTPAKPHQFYIFKVP